MSQSQSGSRNNREKRLWRAAIPRTKGRNGGSRSPRKKRGQRKSRGQRKRKKSSPLPAKRKKRTLTPPFLMTLWWTPHQRSPRKKARKYQQNQVKPRSAKK